MIVFKFLENTKLVWWVDSDMEEGDGERKSTIENSRKVARGKKPVWISKHYKDRTSWPVPWKEDNSTGTQQNFYCGKRSFREQIRRWQITSLTSYLFAINVTNILSLEIEKAEWSEKRDNWVDYGWKLAELSSRAEMKTKNQNVTKAGGIKEASSEERTMTGVGIQRQFWEANEKRIVEKIVQLTKAKGSKEEKNLH